MTGGVATRSSTVAVSAAGEPAGTSWLLRILRVLVFVGGFGTLLTVGAGIANADPVAPGRSVAEHGGGSLLPQVTPPAVAATAAAPTSADAHGARPETGPGTAGPDDLPDPVGGDVGAAEDTDAARGDASPPAHRRQDDASEQAFEDEGAEQAAPEDEVAPDAQVLLEGCGWAVTPAPASAPDSAPDSAPVTAPPPVAEAPGAQHAVAGSSVARSPESSPPSAGPPSAGPGTTSAVGQLPLPDPPEIDPPSAPPAAPVPQAPVSPPAPLAPPAPTTGSCTGGTSTGAGHDAGTGSPVAVLGGAVTVLSIRPGGVSTSAQGGCEADGGYPPGDRPD